MCAKKLFKIGVILWENACCVLEISTEKPENCQLSDSFKEDVRGLIKTKPHLKTSIEVRGSLFFTQSWGQGFHLGVNCGEPKGVEPGIFC